MNQRLTLTAAADPVAEPVRLTPNMVSLRLHVLRFVRRYIGRHHYSPSQGEIAAALNTTRTKVKDALRSLEQEGLLLRTPGQRGLRMPSERDAALRVLLALGWTVANAQRQLSPPPGQSAPAAVDSPADPDFPLPTAPGGPYPRQRRRSRRSRSKGPAAPHDRAPAPLSRPPG